MWAPWYTRRSGKLVAAGNIENTAESLVFLVGLAESGRFRAVIDRTYDLADIALAHRYVDTGHKKGNTVLRVAAG